MVVYDLKEYLKNIILLRTKNLHMKCYIISKIYIK